MSLEAYQSFWNTALGFSDKKRKRRMANIRDSAGITSGFGGAGDPLGAQTPMVQDSMLGQLARRASGENGRIDDWESLVDPTLSYGENLGIILREGGAELESTIQEDRKSWIQSAPDRQQKHAKAQIRENLEAIESGDASHLREDISAEFGEAFVTSAIEEAKALEAPAPDITAPEPAEPSTPEPAEPSTPEPAEPSTPEPAEPSTPEPAEPSTPEPAEPDYPGITGAIELVGELLLESFRAGKRETAPEPTTNANEAV